MWSIPGPEGYGSTQVKEAGLEGMHVRADNTQECARIEARTRNCSTSSYVKERMIQ